MDDDLTDRLRLEAEVARTGERIMRPVLAVDLDHAADEIDRLRQWKSEATTVIGQWDDVWSHAGQPGMLGESKSKAVADEIDRLRATIDKRDDTIAEMWWMVNERDKTVTDVVVEGEK